MGCSWSSLMASNGHVNRSGSLLPGGLCLRRRSRGLAVWGGTGDAGVPGSSSGSGFADKSSSAGDDFWDEAGAEIEVDGGFEEERIGETTEVEFRGYDVRLPEIMGE
ncbi:unnamed protein product [Cuscuta europaea]|uniref:Uncharacterized protein n=1 Tax=Cuscuta europaea TaxID=41803 RepID=A0A9P1A0C5_CUSEU|nr:unnamed protein product [Cuscuta europaea]